VIIPYLGTGLETVFNTWALLALVVAVSVAGDIGLIAALLCALGGWALTKVLPRLAGGRLGTVFQDAWYTVSVRQIRGPGEAGASAPAAMILGVLQTLLLVGVALIVIMALLAPLESLRWWAGWSDNDVAEAAPRAAEAPTPAVPPPGDACYLVWLSGIGSVP